MNTGKFSFNKLFWGLLFILGGISLLMDRMGYLPAFHQISVFGILLTMFFIWMFLQGLQHGNFFAMIFALAFIAIQYDKLLHITPITPGTLLSAALLLSIGLTIIFPNTKNIFPHFHKKGKFVDSGRKVFNEADGEVIHFENTFGSSTKYINTEALVNVSLENSFGEMKVYFDNAIIKTGTAIINIEVSFGSTTIYIPRTWHIENHVSTSIGNVSEKGECISPGCPTLKIYGEVSFGNITIEYI